MAASGWSGRSSVIGQQASVRGREELEKKEEEEEGGGRATLEAGEINVFALLCGPQ